MLLATLFVLANNNPKPIKPAKSNLKSLSTALAYCIPSVPDPEPLTLVSIGTLNNRSSASSTVGYEDFTSMSTDLGVNRTYEIRLQGNTMGNYLESFTVYIDFNQDGVFGPFDLTDVASRNERFQIGYLENSTGEDGKVLVGTISIPLNAVPGKTRMRVLKRQTTKVPIKYSVGGCTLGNTYGQVEDYTVNIVVPQGCSSAPNGANVSPFYVPKNTGAVQTITTTAKTGSYTDILVSEGVRYDLELSKANLFTTLKDANGKTILTTFNQKITWISTFTGLLRWYTHADEASCLVDGSVFTQTVATSGSTNPIKDACSAGIPGMKGFLRLDNGGATSQQLAIDIQMFTGRYSTIKGLKVNLAGDATSINFEELSDANGLPGALLSTIKGTINSKKLAYTQGGKSIYTYDITFDKPILTDGKLGLRKWLKLVSNATYAEVSTNFMIGKNIAISNNTSNGWTLSDQYELVYQLNADCTQDMCTQLVEASDNTTDNEFSSPTLAPFLVGMWTDAIDLLVDPNKQLNVKGIILDIYSSSAPENVNDPKMIEFNFYSNDPVNNIPKTVLTPKVPFTQSKELLETITDTDQDGLVTIYRRYKLTVNFDTPLKLDGATSTRYWLEMSSDYYALAAESDPQAVIGKPVQAHLFGDWTPLDAEAVYQLITDCTTLGTNEADRSEKVKVYPVPFTNTVSISAPEKIKQVEIYNMAGAKVLQNNPNQNKVELNVSQLPVGVYVIRTIDINGKVESTKGIKK